MNKIEMGKSYKTRNGDAVRVLCIDLRDNKYPVVVAMVDVHGKEDLFKYTAEGCCYSDGSASEHNLIEHSPWSDVAVDTKIYVRMSDGDCWEPRYFASCRPGGTVGVLAWDAGTTSFTGNGLKCHWNFAKLAE